MFQKSFSEDTMKFLLLLAFLGAAVAVPEDGEDKIVGGVPCVPNSVPYQVSLNSSYHFCGGVLINEQWVLSAAHCYKSPVQVVVGEHNLADVEGSELVIDVVKIIQHPKYHPELLDNDIMLIKLAEVVVVSNVIAPIPLPEVCPVVGVECLVTGWGNTINNGTVFPDVLQCLEVPVISHDECVNAYPGQITENMICVGNLEGVQGACQGDSGGPVVCGGVLQGIVSRGIGCVLPGYPGVYTKVCNYVEWIKEVVAVN